MPVYPATLGESDREIKSQRRRKAFHADRPRKVNLCKQSNTACIPRRTVPPGLY
jgi:hypothetical protein